MCLVKIENLMSSVLNDQETSISREILEIKFHFLMSLIGANIYISIRFLSIKFKLDLQWHVGLIIGHCQGISQLLKDLHMLIKMTYQKIWISRLQHCLLLSRKSGIQKRNFE
jgi:hypothetical protein